MKISLNLILLFSLNSWAAPSSFDLHVTKIDESVKNCPEIESKIEAVALKAQKDIAEEALSLELAGMRWLRSKPSCFENLKMKYVHAGKNPDEAVSKLVKVKKGSAEVVSIKYDENFFSYRVKFSVLDEKGNKLEDSFSFMTKAKDGGPKPKTGCALIAANPSKAFVSEACLDEE